jgi:hypothetical protein
MFYEEVVYLYAIGLPGGPVKMGMSKDPFRRLGQLKSGCPFRARILFATPIESRVRAADLERQVLQYYEEKNLNGEWFDIDADLAIEAIIAVIETDQHFRQLAIEEQRRRREEVRR